MSFSDGTASLPPDDGDASRALARSIPEVALSGIWFDGWHARELRLTDGRRLNVIYHGTWTHSNGPDFAGAMLEIDRRLVGGAVEIHLKSSDWYRHGHQHDPSYGDIALHVVLDDDLPVPVSGPQGRPIATLELRSYLPGPLETYRGSARAMDFRPDGAAACLPTLAGGQPDLVRRALRSKGWERFVAKQLGFSQSMAVLPAGEVLYRGLLDGLGLTRNRDGMALVGERLPNVTLEAIRLEQGEDGVLAALLGVAGMLPLSPAHENLTEVSPGRVEGLERHFGTLSSRYGLAPLPATVWTLNRVRPLNHPARRLASLASLLVQSGELGLLGNLLSITEDAGTSWAAWLGSARPAIGATRIYQITVNVLAPFLAAYAEVMQDEDLMERAGEIWEQLPGRVEDSRARSTVRQIAGKQRFPIRLAIEEQGLHQIARFGCSELRCFECPIAALAVQYERS